MIPTSRNQCGSVMIKVKRWSFITGFAMLLFALPIHADAQDRGDRPQDRDQIEQRFRRQMVRQIEQRLGLDQTQVQTLVAVIQRHREGRSRLARGDIAVRHRVEALMLESDADQAEAEQLMIRMRRLRIAEAELFTQEQEELLEFLTPVQVLKILSIRAEMSRRIERLRRGDGPPPRRPRGPGQIS